MTAILKLYKHHLLPNYMLDWIEIWAKLRLRKPFDILDVTVAILEFFKRLFPKLESDYIETWWEASGQNQDSELNEVWSDSRVRHHCTI